MRLAEAQREYIIDLADEPVWELIEFLRNDATVSQAISLKKTLHYAYRL
jgi:hypothetical protein